MNWFCLFNCKEGGEAAGAYLHLTYQYFKTDLTPLATGVISDLERSFLQQHSDCTARLKARVYHILWYWLFNKSSKHELCLPPEPDVWPSEKQVMFGLGVSDVNNNLQPNINTSGQALESMADGSYFYSIVLANFDTIIDLKDWTWVIEGVQCVVCYNIFVNWHTNRSNEHYLYHTTC